MTEHAVPEAVSEITDVYAWLGHVLDRFSQAEQALGRLSSAVELPIANGSLGSLQELQNRLTASGDRRAVALERRIARWVKNRPVRNLLAHATVTRLFDAEGNMIVVTRHLPRDSADPTPDRVWTAEEQRDLLRQASNDGRSICDHVKNLLGDATVLAKLREP